MTLASIRFSTTGEIISKYGSPHTDLDQIRAYIDNPTIILAEYGLQTSRQIDGQRYTITAWRPYQQIVLDDQLVIHTGGNTDTFNLVQFWNKIQETILTTKNLLDTHILEDQSDKYEYLGYYGYVGFEVSRLIETYSCRSDHPPYPYLVFDFPTRYIVSGPSFTEYIELQLPSIPSVDLVIDPVDPIPSDTIIHSTSYSKYINDLEQIIHHIQQGDIYQANYTQQFRMTLPADTDVAELYSHILSTQNLPHAAFLNYGDVQIVSLSPELFLRVTHGKVLTKPIKGTRQRGSNDVEDQQLIDELINSTKDHAELAMIVDLLRNDLGKSALPGSVNVVNHAIIESYENVHHLVSTIEAELHEGLEDTWRLFLRAFPGGSISGVPKLRAVEIIEKHEKVPRGIYTGNIGYLGLTGELEFNIVIRTAIVMNNQVSFNAGGGIVYDSNPIDEYIESLHKAKHLAQYFNHTFIGHLRWYDGKIVEIDTVKPSPVPPGVFETILIEDGQLIRYDRHLARFRHGLANYGIDEELIPSLEDIELLLRLNLVSSGSFRLNLFGWHDESGDHISAKVQTYTRPDPPLTLFLRSTPFSVPNDMKDGLKSLEYDDYHKATIEAIQHGAWDSILIDNDKYILEGGRSTLFFFTNRWITPSRHVVQGTIRQILINSNTVETTYIGIDDLEDIKSIAVGNALIGIMPVKSIIDDHNVIWNETDSSKVKFLREQLE